MVGDPKKAAGSLPGTRKSRQCPQQLGMWKCTMPQDLATAKPDVAASREASTLPAHRVVTRVADTIGPRITALIAGVKDTRTITAWKESGRIPTLEFRKLQIALAAILTLSPRYGDPSSIGAWFTWLNDSLDDYSPASLIAEATEENVDSRGRDVVRAARLHLTE